ncbi:pleckstrin domain containing protein [Planoprotostelium fungivorum]|uniref:Pleckstrin domain containing protein n=1 Tax=Planoprotostelium fungivorum TaxID=1890364 RepID=A0A2P6MWJ8_9EUKA|nr:pleckstrin domain containing protein [Planoprotostelium fungivorum]
MDTNQKNQIRCPKEILETALSVMLGARGVSRKDVRRIKAPGSKSGRQHHLKHPSRTISEGDDDLMKEDKAGCFSSCRRGPHITYAIVMALRKASVFVKVLDQLVQQKAEQIGDLSKLNERLTSIEVTLSNVNPTIESDIPNTLNLLVAAFEIMRELVLRFDKNKDLILFRRDREIAKLLRFEQRLSSLEDGIQNGKDIRPLDILSEQEALFWGDHFKEAAVSKELGNQNVHKMAKLKRVLCIQDKAQVSIFSYSELTNGRAFTEALREFNRKKRSDARSSVVNGVEPIQAGSLWRGTVWQIGTEDFNIIVEFKSRKGNTFKGEIVWCSTSSENITSFEAQLEDGAGRPYTYTTDQNKLMGSLTSEPEQLQKLIVDRYGSPEPKTLKKSSERGYDSDTPNSWSEFAGYASSASKNSHNITSPRAIQRGMGKSPDTVYNADVAGVLHSPLSRSYDSMYQPSARDVQENIEALRSKLSRSVEAEDEEIIIKSSNYDDDSLVLTMREVEHIRGDGVLPLPARYQGELNLTEKILIGTWTCDLEDVPQEGFFALSLDTRPQPLLVQDPNSPVPARKESTEVIAEGFLTKRGDIRPSWRRRYFVFTSACLTYYKSTEHHPDKPAGRVDTNTIVSVETVPDSANMVNLFLVHTPGRKYRLMADTPQQQKKWIDAIRSEIEKRPRT